MKTYFHAFAMCQSMFCAIPFPGNLWDENARDKMLLFLPLVGLEIGLIWAALAWLLRLLALPGLLQGLALAVYPYLVTGFLHLDGYMDVTDAVKSCRDLARRREILKDSHVGSFAVIGVVLLVVAQFAFLASVPESAPLGVLCLIPMVSRCGSALAVTALPAMSTSQYANQRKNTVHLILLSLMLLAALILSFVCFGRYGFALIAGMVGYDLALNHGFRSLAGMNGDIAGYALTLSELCALAVYSIL